MLSVPAENLRLLALEAVERLHAGIARDICSCPGDARHPPVAVVTEAGRDGACPSVTTRTDEV